MVIGEPLEVRPGACFVNTSYWQDGEELNWDDTVDTLAYYEESRPHVRRGSGFAVASYLVGLSGSSAFLAGSWDGRGITDHPPQLRENKVVIP